MSDQLTRTKTYRSRLRLRISSSTWRARRHPGMEVDHGIHLDTFGSRRIRLMRHSKQGRVIQKQLTFFRFEMAS
jgi:hypothetical protein